MESQYCKYGRRRKDFTMRVKVSKHKTSTVKVENIISHSNMKLRLMYFPFEDGIETMPIPHSIKNDPSTPLNMRKPGIEVFWNERLIKEGFMNRLRDLCLSSSSAK